MLGLLGAHPYEEARGNDLTFFMQGPSLSCLKRLGPGLGRAGFLSLFDLVSEFDSSLKERTG